MYASYVNFLREAMNRVMGAIMLGLAVIVACIYLWFVQVDQKVFHQSGIYLLTISGHMLGTNELGVQALLDAQMGFLWTYWQFLSLIAVGQLLGSTLEKGWIELTFSKGTSRWRILMGRYLGSLTLGIGTAALAIVPSSLRLWIQTGIKPVEVVPSLLLLTLSLAALVSLATLASLSQKGMALPIFFPIVVWVISPILWRRQIGLYQLISSTRIRWLLEWLYRILPKNSELFAFCSSYIHHLGNDSWWPVWSTSIFAICVLGLTLWLLHRKSL